MRNYIFFPLKCNAFQAGFHGWLRGGGRWWWRGGGRERERKVRLSRSYYCAPLSQPNLHINHRRRAQATSKKPCSSSSRTPGIKCVCHCDNIIFIIGLRQHKAQRPGGHAVSAKVWTVHRIKNTIVSYYKSDV